MRAIVLLALAAQTALSFGQWVPIITWSLEHHDLSAEVVSEEVGVVENPNAEPIFAGFSGIFQTVRTVTGSTAAAPWSASFTPLSTDYTWHQFSAPLTEIPAGKKFVAEATFDLETVNEEWKGTLSVGSAFFVESNRRWQENISVAYWLRDR